MKVFRTWNLEYWIAYLNVWMSDLDFHRSSDFEKGIYPHAVGVCQRKINNFTMNNLIQ